MSTQLFDHNPDLKKLKDEGYNISIINGHIVIQGVPYLNSDKKVFFDSIYCPFTQEGFKIRQNDHTVFFTGEYPCDQLGNELSSIVNDHRQDILREDIIGKFYLSSKPESGSYSDFYAKMQRYVDLLSAPAKSVDPSVDAKNFDYISYMVLFIIDPTFNFRRILETFRKNRILTLFHEQFIFLFFIYHINTSKKPFKLS